MMKYLIMILVVGFSEVFAQEKPSETFLKHLEGTWLMEGEGESRTRESWIKTSDDYYEGNSAFLRSTDGGFRDVEKLALFKFHTLWFYMAHPAQNKYPTLFELTEANDTTALFVNSEHDYPQQIRYTFINTDSLSAEISLTNNKNLRKFKFKKITGKDDRN